MILFPLSLFFESREKRNNEDMEIWESVKVPEIENFRAVKTQFGKNEVIQTNAEGEKLITAVKGITETFYGKEKIIERVAVFKEHSIDHIIVKVKKRGDTE